MTILTDEEKVTLSYAKESSVALMKDMVALVERLEDRINEFYAPNVLYGCRAFIEQCVKAKGTTVDGDQLSEHARRVLACDSIQPKTTSEE